MVKSKKTSYVEKWIKEGRGTDRGLNFLNVEDTILKTIARIFTKGHNIKKSYNCFINGTII